MLLLVTLHHACHLAWVDPVEGVVERVVVGRSPWGLAVGPDGRAWMIQGRPAPSDVPRGG